MPGILSTDLSDAALPLSLPFFHLYQCSLVSISGSKIPNPSRPQLPLRQPQPPQPVHPPRRRALGLRLRPAWEGAAAALKQNSGSLLPGRAFSYAYDGLRWIVWDLLARHCLTTLTKVNLLAQQIRSSRKDFKRESLNRHPQDSQFVAWVYGSWIVGSCQNARGLCQAASRADRFCLACFG